MILLWSAMNLPTETGRFCLEDFTNSTGKGILIVLKTQRMVTLVKKNWTHWNTETTNHRNEPSTQFPLKPDPEPRVSGVAHNQPSC